MNRSKVLLAAVLLSLAARGAFAFNPLFSTRIDYPASSPYPLCSADFNNDGKADLAAGSWYAGSISILRNNGDGTFAATVGYGVNRHPWFVCAADFNADGRPDLAVTSESSNTVSIMINRSTAVATMLGSYQAGLTGASIRVSWTLSEIDDDIGFPILRAEGPNWDFNELSDVFVQGDGLSFTFTDATCLPGSGYKYRVDCEGRAAQRRTLFETDVIATPALAATLYQNHPNPFNPSTEIEYYLPAKSRVTVEIFDVTGKRVARLVKREQEKGCHAVQWNGRDDLGAAAGSGVYFCRLRAGKETISRKMILLR